MKILNLRKSILYISIGLLLLFILNSLNCSGRVQGIQNFHNKTPAKLVFHIKFELTGYGFEVIANHTSDDGEEERLDLNWTKQDLYSYTKIIKAFEGDTIFFKTSPKIHICSMQNTLVTLKITIKKGGQSFGNTYIETSDQTSVWEEITLKRGMLKIQTD